MNKSYIESQLEWLFTVYPDEGWRKDADALDGNLALSTGGKGSGRYTAQGVETRNNQGSVVPMISRREIISKMDTIKQQSPELYKYAQFVYSGSAAEADKALKEARDGAAALLNVLCKDRG